MECKNCENSLRSDFSFCPTCGAKVIRHRLTIKNIWQDLSFQFFNWDNTFFKTFKHLFTKPEGVIGGFISGTRKKYMNPISYFTIAITLTSILVFFMKKAFPEGFDFDIMDTGIYDAQTNKRMTDFLLNFYNILFIIQIPVYAVAGYISLLDKKFLFSEHLVTFIYTQAQYSITSAPVTLIVILLAPTYYMALGFIFIVLTLIYSLWVLKRLHLLKGQDFWLKAFIFLVVFGFGYIMLSILQAILMIATGITTFNF